MKGDDDASATEVSAMCSGQYENSPKQILDETSRNPYETI